MSPSPQRVLTERNVHSMAALDTIDLIEQRVRNLLSHGRRITVACRPYTWTGGAPEVTAGLTVAEDVKAWRDGDGAGFSVLLATSGPSIGQRLGVAAYGSDGNTTQAEAWKRYHAGKAESSDWHERRRDMTHVQIVGGLRGDGPARDDSLTIQSWNRDGVCSETVVAFDYDTGPGRLTRLRQEVQDHIDNLADKQPWDNRAMFEHVLQELGCTADMRADIDVDAEVTALRDAAQAAKSNDGDRLPYGNRSAFVDWLNRRADRFAAHLEGKDA